jgi:hypothetical protein
MQAVADPEHHSASPERFTTLAIGIGSADTDILELIGIQPEQLLTLVGALDPSVQGCPKALNPLAARAL